MTPLGWARCVSTSADVLRRGAWYPIVEESSDGHVFLEVDRQRVRVSRVDLQVRPKAPEAWSVVVRTGVMRPTWSGGGSGTNTYAVCPSCRERQYFEAKPTQLECKRCKHVAAVDWMETC